MNEPTSSRYHRLRRRAAGAETIAAAAVLATLLAAGWSVRLRELTGGSAAAYALVLGLLLEAVILPLAWYRTSFLEQRFRRSPAPRGSWLPAHLQGAGLIIIAGVAAAGLLQACMRAWPAGWWLAAAGGGALCLAILTVAAPVLILPAFYRLRPLERPSLRRRLLELSRRAGVPALGVYEWGTADAPRAATAALVGAGSTRRILLSPSLLAGYSDDEIEAVVAHEIGHHVHGDMLQGFVLELAVLAGGFLAAAWTLSGWWRALGLASAVDPAGLPLVILSIGSADLLASPARLALSRRGERRADGFALQLASRPDALAGVIRRLAAETLAEERPSRAAVWLFHSHPPAEERIRDARLQPGTAGAGAGAALQPERGKITDRTDRAAIT